MTPTDTFRLSTYAALISACVCLGYSEWDLLPEAAVFAALVVALLIGLFFFESRFELSLAAANRVGLGIGIVSAAWLAYQFINQNSLIYTFPWPASLLPYLGPLLMVLIPAKMVRPKHEGDWWAMQGVGLAGAALASAMAEDARFGVLLLIYAVCAAWAVTLFFVHRAAGWLDPVPGVAPIATAHGVGTPRAVGRSAIGWAAVALLVALPAFFFTPRSQSNRWQFVRPSLETGYSSQDSIDLNRGGILKASRDLAFTVTRPNGGQTPDNQRWRGRTYTSYDKGVWLNTGGEKIAAEVAHGLIRQTEPNGTEFRFARTSGTGDPIFADPVSWRPGEPLPIGTVGRVPTPGWYQSLDTNIRVSSSLAADMPYWQFYAPFAPPDRDLGPGFDLTRGQPEVVTLAPYIRLKQVPPGVARWAAATLQRLATLEPKLAAAAARARAGLPIDPTDTERVAKAFAHHLAHSSDYTYTSRLTRLDIKADPVEEFLTRTKSGHCQRYAAGLVLALRSLGMPSQYVLGFKGWEADPERPNVMLIRHEHAHAWAEVLVPRTANGDVKWHWLSLDPTPDGVAAGEDPGSWLDTASDQGRTFFLDFIVGYNPDRRQKTVAAAKEWFARAGWQWLVGFIALATVSLLAPRVRRQFHFAPAAPPRPTTGIAVYDHFRLTLARAGLEPQPGETPREFANRATDWLASHDPSLQALPHDVTEAMQSERYAGQPADLAETTRLIALLEKLAMTVTAQLRRQPQ